MSMAISKSFAPVTSSSISFESASRRRHQQLIMPTRFATESSRWIKRGDDLASRLFPRPAPVLTAGILIWRALPHAIHHHQRRRRDLLQGLGSERGATDRLPSRLAAQRRRLGQSDDVL